MSDQTPQHWIELFKDEEWNKFSQNETEDFSGKIIYTTEGAGPSIQMRFTPYKLLLESAEMIDIHCSNLEELREFIGKEVVMQGKKMSCSLYGMPFTEIWPTRMRLQ
jgi:hypothetical protein